MKKLLLVTLVALATSSTALATTLKPDSGTKTFPLNPETLKFVDDYLEASHKKVWAQLHASGEYPVFNNEFNIVEDYSQAYDNAKTDAERAAVVRAFEARAQELADQNNLVTDEDVYEVLETESKARDAEIEKVVSQNDQLSRGRDNVLASNIAEVNAAAAQRDSALSRSTAKNAQGVSSNKQAIAVNRAAIAENKHSINKLNNRVSDLDKRLSAGIAGALSYASLPNAYKAGGSTLGAGVGTYNGQSAIAVGYSVIDASGVWSAKVGVNADTAGNFGAGAGIGYNF